MPEAAGEVSAEEAPKKAVKINEEAVKKAAKEFLDQVFGAMGMQVSIETAYNASDRELLVSMEGDDMGILHRKARPDSGFFTVSGKPCGKQGDRRLLKSEA